MYGWQWSTYAKFAHYIDSAKYPQDYHKGQLAIAIERNRPLILKRLLHSKGGIDFIVQKKTLVHFAIECNKHRILRILLKTNGVPLNIESLYLQETALIQSLRLCEENLAVALIEAGADVNLVNECGDSALHYAIENLCLYAAKLLIQKGININYRNNEGKTALFIACEMNSIEAIYMLLYYNADVSITTYENEEPFTIASNEAVEILWNYVYKPVHLSTIITAIKKRSSRIDILLETANKILYTPSQLLFFKNLAALNPKYLKLFLNFENLVGAFIKKCPDYFNNFIPGIGEGLYYSNKIAIIKNLKIVMNSKASSFMFNRILNRFRIDHFIDYFNIGDDECHEFLLKLTEDLIKQGLDFDSDHVAHVFLTYGFCSLFKAMIKERFRRTRRYKHLMPILIYDVGKTLDWFSEEYLRDYYDLSSLYVALDYFSNRWLKRLCLKLHEGEIYEKLLKVPELPTLLELARDATRKCIVESYGIKNFREFCEVIEEIPEDFQKILTFEQKINNIF